MIVAAIPFGVLAICISRAIYTQIAVVINTYYTGKLFGLGYMEQVRDFSVYLIYSLCAVIPAFVLTMVNLNSVLNLVLGSSLAIFVYYILLRKNSNFLELIALVKSSV